MNILDARRYAKNKEIRKQRMKSAREKGTHTPAEWSALVAEFDGRCVQCWSEEFKVEKDHIIPVYQGGSDAIDNLQPLCAYCNTGKGPDSFNWVQYRRSQK